MELTNEYQYIGRSNVVKDQNNKYGYYILLYAKTSGGVTTGKHTATVKMRLVSEMNTFYGYATSGSIAVAGVSAASRDWQTVPGAAWNTTSITADGVTYSKWVDLKEGSVSIDVGYGVQKDVTITASFTMRDSSQSWLPQAGVSAKISQTVTLPMIAGASAITSAADVVLGKACSVKWTPLAASLAYKLQFSLGNWSYTTGVILPAGNTEYTYTGYTIPMTVANQIPSSPTGTMTVKLYTYSDSTCALQIGSANTQTFTVTVPIDNNTRPTPGMNLSAVSSLGSAFTGLYVQGYTKVAASFSGSGKYGASIKSYAMNVAGKTYGTPYTSGYLTQSGEITVMGTAVDSRGYSGSEEKTITVIPYGVPKIQVSICGRCDSAENLTESGTYLKIKANRTYSKVISGGVQKNFCSIRYRYKMESGTFSAWETILAGSNTGTDEVATGAMLGSLSVSSTYVVQISAIDEVGNESITAFTLLSEAVFMHRRAGGKGMGLGKYCEEDNLLDVAWNLRVRGDILVGDSGITLEEYIKSFLT